MSRVNRLAILLFAATLSANGPAVADRQADSSAQTPRTTMLGSRDQQFLLAKITVSDLRRSYKFYTEVIGLKWATAPSVPLDEPLGLKDPDPLFAEIPMNFNGSLGDPFFVIVKKRDSDPSPDLADKVWIGFKVPDAAAAVARAKETGAEVVRETGAGAMKFGFIKDPDGYNIEFIEAAANSTRDAL